MENLNQNNQGQYANLYANLQGNPYANPDMKNLHRKFVELGRQRNRLLNELLAILPEIYQSGIWKRHADSIVEYAGKFGGISKSAVLKRLRLEKYLTDKPALKEAIKTVGVNKVALVASIAKPETDEAFADKVKNMSKSAVATLAKEMRGNRQAQKVPDTFFCSAVPTKIKLEMDEEMSFLFMKLKEKWKLTNSETMKMLLQKTISAEFPEKRVSINAMRTQTFKKVKAVTGDNFCKSRAGAGRYITTYQKRAVLSQTNGQCSYPHCNKPVAQFHHTERFMRTKSHQSLVPLCRDHHEFPHNGLIQNEVGENEAGESGVGENAAGGNEAGGNVVGGNQVGESGVLSQNWQLNISAKPTNLADILYRKYRQAALT